MLVWTGQAVSILGTRLVNFAIIWWLTVETKSASVLAVASLMQILPQTLFSPFIGTLIDRWNRRITMIATDVLNALAILGLVFLFHLESMETWHVFIWLLLRSFGDITHGTAMTASTSLMVPKEQLTRISGLNQALAGAGNIAGPLIGAVMIALFPIHTILLIDVITIIPAIIPILIISIPQPPQSAQDNNKKGVIFELKEGFNLLKEFKGLFFLFFYLSITFTLAAPAWRFLPLLVTEHLLGDEVLLGAITSAFGIGSIIGGSLLGIWGGSRKRIKTTILARFGSGICYLVLGLIPSGNFILPVLACASFGITFSISLGSQRAVLLAVVPSRFQGRIFSIFGWSQAVLQPLGFAIFGFFGELTGIAAMFLFSGSILIGCAIFMRLTPALMTIEDTVIEKE